MEPISRGDIYYAALDNAIGSEQAGQRPVLILQCDQLNQKSPTSIIAPITSIIKHPFMQSHCILPLNRPLRERSMVLTEQVRVVDRQRLGAYGVDIMSRKRKRNRRRVSPPSPRKKPQEEMMLSLCPACAQQFYDSPEHKIKRADYDQIIYAHENKMRRKPAGP